MQCWSVHTTEFNFFYSGPLELAPNDFDAVSFKAVLHTGHYNNYTYRQKCQIANTSYTVFCSYGTAQGTFAL